MMVDWEGIAEEYPGRTAQNIKEHWLRVVQPALVEDTEPDAILAYRRRLLEEVRKMGAGHRKDISWRRLAVIFHPRSSSSIQCNFSDLTKEGSLSKKIESVEEFHQRVANALAKVERMSQLPDRELAKKFTRDSYKTELREYYNVLIEKTSHEKLDLTDSDTESEDS